MENRALDLSGSEQAQEVGCCGYGTATFRFYEMWKISWLDMGISASKEELCQFSWLVNLVQISVCSPVVLNEAVFKLF